MGLGADVLKAPHHGGRVYFDDRREAVEQFYLWARPRTVLVSANGKHNLPRSSVREAVRKIGASLICPNSRNLEMLTAGTPDGEYKSCYKAYNCCSAVGRAVSKIVLKAGRESVDVAACVQGLGHSGAAPIVVMQQSVVVPSEAFVRWTRGELDKHSQWILAQLKKRQKDFLAYAKSSPTIMASQQPVKLSTILSLAKSVGRHDLAADPAPVLKFARSQHLFWVNIDRYGSHIDELYRYPTQSELRHCEQWLTNIPHIFVQHNLSDEDMRNCDRISILQGAEWTALQYMLAIKLGVPVELASSEVLPALLPLMAETFKLQVCSLDYAHRPFDGGRALLWLRNPKANDSFPDLEFIKMDTLHGQDVGFLAKLFLEAESNVLMAMCIRKDEDKHYPTIRRWSVWNGWMKSFEDRYHNQFKVHENLVSRMKSASWIELW